MSNLSTFNTKTRRLLFIYAVVGVQSQGVAWHFPSEYLRPMPNYTDDLNRATRPSGSFWPMRSMIITPKKAIEGPTLSMLGGTVQGGLRRQRKPVSKPSTSASRLRALWAHEKNINPISHCDVSVPGSTGAVGYSDELLTRQR